MISRYRIRRLLAPTAGLRWAVLWVVIGLICLLVGASLSFRQAINPLLESTGGWWNDLVSRFVPKDDLDRANHYIGGGLLVLGLYWTYYGAKIFFRRMFEVFGLKSPTGNVFLRRQMLAQGPRIVALGGGTGLSTLLRGLKQHTSNITAVVTVTDDGGSSGRLVQEMNMIPPGDIRNCLVALADAEKQMTDLFQHRFKNKASSISGHSLGNLLIAGLVEQCDGDVDKALMLASEVLNIRGRVLPSTLSNVRLRALMEDGSEICGETKIVEARLSIRRIFLDPDNAVPHPDAIEAIREADLICIGPGSVYTSVIPNLLVPGIAEAIRQSSAVTAYICNVMTQPGESDAFTSGEHVVAIQANIDQKVFDYVLVNTGIPSPSSIEKYRGSGQHLVEADIDRIRAMGFKVAAGNYMSESDYVRHDPMRVAERLMGLLER